MGKTRNCFKFIISLTKLLCNFPVSEKDNNIIFQWLSFKTFCFLALFISSFINFSFNICENVLEYLLIILEVTGMASKFLFFVMAMNWSELMKQCDRIDFYMKSYGFPKYLKLKLQVVCVILMTLSLVEYSVFDVYLLNNPILATYAFIGVWKVAVRTILQDASVVSVFKLSILIIQKLSHCQNNMLRCCVDIFIITVSVILSARLQQIRKRVDSLIRRKIRDETVWIQAREDYQRLCMFCEKWDDALGYLLLASFASNIYHLLLNIQGVLTVSDATDKLFTTIVSVECLLRCMMVCYAAGNVYEESRKLIRLLVLTPSDVFNDEIERMLLQLRQAQPALTGAQLFTVKHSLILQILGLIATHEIILLQYYKPKIIN